MRVLYTAPMINKFGLSEPFVAFKWAEALSDLVDLTVLCFEPSRPEHGPLAEHLPNATVITWPKPQLPRALQRLEAMLKPTYPVYCRRVSETIKAAQASGQSFDIAHQIMPQGARYRIPLRGHGMPYVVGPLGGSLPTPAPFQSENAASSSWFTRLRALDAWRFRYDPALRASYRDADLILGVAPYMEETLSAIPLKRFEPVLELGIDALPPLPPRPDTPSDRLELVHVGRGVRTKGLRDAVRAMAHLKDLADVHLTSAGTGPEIEICKAEAARLGVADRITFLGQISREAVSALYARSDIFVFPSFREAAGNVVYEAMSHGLPIVTAARGGPDFIVDDSFGHRIPVTTPEAYPKDIAAAVRALHADPARRAAMGAQARARLAEVGLWRTKAQGLVDLYAEVLAARGEAP